MISSTATTAPTTATPSTMSSGVMEEPLSSSAASAVACSPSSAGAVVSAEPGIYLPGRFGVRIEDVIVLEEGGCRDITLAPKDLLIL